MLFETMWTSPRTEQFNRPAELDALGQPIVMVGLGTCTSPRAAAARPRTCLLAVLALVGCAGGPVTGETASAPSVVVPSSWSAAQVAPAGAVAAPAPGSQALQRWWLRFDDPALSALVGRALRANTSVLAAQAALQQAVAARDMAAAALWPGLRLAASVQRGSAGGHSTGTSLQAALAADWVPDLFGARRSALHAQDATVGLRSANLGDMQLAIASEVALDYIVLRSSQARLAIADANLASQRQTLQITRWREQAGLVTAVDSAQAATAVAQTAAALPPLQVAIAQTRHALAVLIGQPPASTAAVPDQPELWTLLDAPGAVPQATGHIALAIPAETLRQRADVRAAEHQVSAALALVDQAEAARFPGFALGGSIGVGAASIAGLADRAAVVSSLLASLSVPLFDGGALRAQVRVQRAALLQARVAHQATVLAALQDVEDALVALEGDRRRQRRLDEATAAALQAATLARQRYDSGLVDFQTVLNTQRTQLAAQDSQALSQASIGADQVRLFKALGGGWLEDGANPPNPADPSTPSGKGP